MKYKNTTGAIESTASDERGGEILNMTDGF